MHILYNHKMEARDVRAHILFLLLQTFLFNVHIPNFTQA